MADWTDARHAAARERAERYQRAYMVTSGGYRCARTDDALAALDEVERLRAALRIAHDATSAMWDARYDVSVDGLASVSHIPGPVVVDLGLLAIAETALSEVVRG
jgi:hypothetical protein